MKFQDLIKIKIFTFTGHLKYFRSGTKSDIMSELVKVKTTQGNKILKERHVIRAFNLQSIENIYCQAVCTKIRRSKWTSKK